MGRITFPLAAIPLFPGAPYERAVVVIIAKVKQQALIYWPQAVIPFIISFSQHFFQYFQAIYDPGLSINANLNTFRHHPAIVNPNECGYSTFMEFSHHYR